jgi:O-antigen/teichoic acid export membrane protein
VSGTTIIQFVIVVLVAAGLGYAVVQSADGWADWVVFGVIVCAALGAAIAVWNRQYPAQTKKRTFTRDSDESNW